MPEPTEILPMLVELLTEMGHKFDPDSEVGAITIAQLGLDSLDLLELLMLVDERLGVEVTTDTVNFDTTLAELTDHINQQSA